MSTKLSLLANGEKPSELKLSAKVIKFIPVVNYGERKWEALS